MQMEQFIVMKLVHNLHFVDDIFFLDSRSDLNFCKLVLRRYCLTKYLNHLGSPRLAGSLLNGTVDCTISAFSELFADGVLKLLLVKDQASQDLPIPVPEKSNFAEAR